MRRSYLQSVIVVLLLLVSSSEARVVRLSFTGAHIPVKIETGASMLFLQSDSLWLNGVLLERERDYLFVSRGGYFELKSLTQSDRNKLIVQYEPLPDWIVRSFGRSLPEPAIGEGDQAFKQIQKADQKIAPRSVAGFNISGAKSFRFSSRTTGSSDFGQSLDLRLSGEISEGVKLEGSVTDRGFDPGYGTLNSRLSELDKIHLQLTSKHLVARVGDIVLSESQLSGRRRDLSGASFNLDYSRWHLSGSAARPKGEFRTVRIAGKDNSQGPYQIGEGDDIRPIVPGSETVWLDGTRLERGANKDYSIDYPVGRITFNVNRPIDERSRIEVDYEPRNTDYKMKLFSSSAGIRSLDSSRHISFSILAEGDDAEQSLGGDLSEQDRELFSSSGEGSLTKSGIVSDTAGNYIFVADSLPDSILEYVGEGNGTYRVTFSFVGVSNGAYQFLGSSIYTYVGAGKGEYLPIVRIRAPRRTVEYRSIAQFESRLTGKLTADMRLTSFDRNILSSFDNESNNGKYYDLINERVWKSSSGVGSFKLRRRLREERYHSLERTNRSDFEREFFLPFGYVAKSDELLQNVALKVPAMSGLQLSGTFDKLSYSNSYDVSRGIAKLKAKPVSRLSIDLGWQNLTSKLKSDSADRNGSVRTYDMLTQFRPYSSVSWSNSIQYDRRTNDYLGEEVGTKYYQIESRLDLYSESVRYELFLEDSLNNDWKKSLTRNRLSVNSTRRLGKVNYTAIASYQWLDKPDAVEENFLSRVSAGFNDFKKQLSSSVSFAVSEERRNARGINYLEVGPGQGDFSREDSLFVPDRDGNFIRVEELLSDVSKVRRGEKSFAMSKSWHMAVFRFNSTIQEELLEEGSRGVLWVLPFYSDRSQSYLSYSRRYESEIRAFPIKNFYLFNLRLSQDVEIRRILSLPREREDVRIDLSLRQATGLFVWQERLELFNSDRDTYFAGAGAADGFRVSAELRKLSGGNEISLESAYRKAKSQTDQQSEQYSLLLGLRLVVLRKGELRFSVEGYQQRFTNLSSVADFALTANRTGSRGALWSTSLNYGVKGGTKVRMSISGRHSDDRVARLIAKGEVVTSF